MAMTKYNVNNNWNLEFKEIGILIKMSWVK